MKYFPLFFALGLIIPITVSAQENQPANAGEADLLPINIAPGGLTADLAAKKAMINGPSAKKAKIDVEIAQLKADGGLLAFLPKVELNASYTRLSDIDQAPLNFGGMEIDLFPVQLNAYALSANLIVPLTDYFLTILPAYRSAQLSVKIGEAQLKVGQERIALQAQEAYFGYVRARIGAAIAKDTVGLLQSSIVDIKALSAVGQTARVDVLQAEAQLADANVRVALADSGVENAGTYLRILLGMEKNEEIVLGENPFREPASSPEFNALYQEAYDNRPEILAIQQVLKIQGHAIDAESGGMWPRLLLLGTINYSNPNQRFPLASDEFNFNWSTTLALSWSPNTYVAQRLRANVARSERLKTGFDLKLVEQQLTIEVTRALSEIRVARQTLAASKKGLQASEEAYRARRELFAAGESTTSEVLASQLSLRGAKTSQLDAYIMARIAEVRLKHVQGKASENAVATKEKK